MSCEQIYNVRVMVLGSLSSLSYDKDLFLFCGLLSAGILPIFAVNDTSSVSGEQL